MEPKETLITIQQSFNFFHILSYNRNSKLELTSCAGLLVGPK